jgi:hypothetical protein
MPRPWAISQLERTKQQSCRIDVLLSIWPSYPIPSDGGGILAGGKLDWGGPKIILGTMKNSLLAGSMDKVIMVRGTEYTS